MLTEQGLLFVTAIRRSKDFTRQVGVPVRAITIQALDGTHQS